MAKTIKYTFTIQADSGSKKIKIKARTPGDAWVNVLEEYGKPGYNIKLEQQV